MTITSIKAAGKKTSGFTLLEIMITMAIFSIVMVSVLSTFILFAKGSLSVGNYAEMSSQSRKALELFSRDVRAADRLKVTSPKTADGVVYTDAGIELRYPPYHGARVVRYEYIEGAFRRTEIYDGKATTSDLLTDVRHLQMKFFQTPGANFTAVSGPAASVDTWAKSIQLDAELLRKVLTADNTDYIISARFMMRN